MEGYMKDKPVFATKEASDALIQSKRTVAEALKATQETFDVEVSKSNTELLGVLPYLFSFGAYAFENFKEMVIDMPKITHYQLGSEKDPIPLETLYRYTIGEYVEQKELFHAELYRLMREKRARFLPNNYGGHTLTEPISIAVVTEKGVSTDGALFNSLVTKTEGGTYEHTPRVKIKGVILQYYKPLFEGHFNGYKGGFIKQPQLLYAIARHYHSDMSEAALKDFTPVKIVQLFYYIATHCNYRGSKITVDAPEMLKHILPSALEGESIRHRNMGPILAALQALTSITSDYKDCFDFVINGLNITEDDRDFAKEADDETEQVMLEVKHHLKANGNRLEIAVTQQPRAALSEPVQRRRKTRKE
jgi:hypothetical protein